MVAERDLLVRKVVGLQDKVVSLEQRRLCLTYNDLKPGGMLESSVKEFTFFPDFECNEAFLELINFGDDGEEGLCQNMVRYSKVSVATRRDYQLSADEEAAETLRQMYKGRQRKVHWKTEWLIYNFYARCGISMKRISVLFGVGKTLVHDIVYAWANLLCVLPVQTFSFSNKEPHVARMF